MSNTKLLDDYVNDIQFHLREGNFNLALEEIKKAIVFYPTNPKLYINGGNIYKLLKDLNNAELFYDKALSLHKSKEVLNNLSVICIERRNYDKAISLAKDAIEIDASYVDALYNLALSLDSLGKYDEAEKYSSKACALDNYKQSKYLVLLFRILQNTCNWKDIPKIAKMLDHHIGDGTEHPFLNISRYDNEESNYKVALAWNSNQPKIANKASSPNEKIRLGYLCGEFRNHPTNHLIKNLFRFHDTSKFEIYIFSYNHDEASRISIENEVTEFVNLNDMDNINASKSIADHNLDILIDLTIIISNNRQDIIRDRPAKKIISYLGYPGTSGSNIYDYIITDETVTPIVQQKYYTEKFLYLPRSYQINDGERMYKNKSLTVRQDHNLPESSIVLSCFNQSFKIEQTMFNCWIDILEQIPNSCLWLLEDNEISKNNIYSYIKETKIDRNRIIFAPRVNRREHLDRLQHSNICLDTRFYNGHTTTTDSIQSGVPVITMIGNHFASRVSASLLMSIGLNELIVDSIPAYKALVIKLASDKDYMDKIKNKLIGDNSLTDDFYNTKKFVNDLENSLMSITN